jgi:hypothetical protein
VYFGFFSVNFETKFFTSKDKIKYKWDLDGIPPDTLHPTTRDQTPGLMLWCLIKKKYFSVGREVPVDCEASMVISAI